jgi:uncharacterized BrkB/YihY/UPF0761 family membrane protein
MNSQWLGHLTFKELAVRTWREANEDNILGRAAELALMGAVILIGGEVNAEIAHAADQPIVQKEESGRPR